MTLSEMDMYMTTLDEVENRIIDDTKFPVVKDNKIKTCCYTTLELLKMSLNYINYNITNATKKNKGEGKTQDKID